MHPQAAGRNTMAGSPPQSTPRSARGVVIWLAALLPCLLVLVGAAAIFAAPAGAANMIFWTDPYFSNSIFEANLDGSSASPASLNTTGATGNKPWGVAADPAAGKIYWANYSGGKISWANLDGSGGGDLPTGAATVQGPSGLVVNHAAGKVYWANATNKISWANLDGSGGGDLNTGTATVSLPVGVAIDSAQGKIYWANYNANSIAFANLDGSGGGNLNPTGATLSEPWGIVIDTANGTIIWGNFGADSLDYARLDGTGGGVLSTTGATTHSPMPGAIDPASGRLYWSNWSSGGILFAAANGGGAGGALYPTASQPAMPAVLEAPVGVAAPSITSTGATTPATLSCSPGGWGADLLGELLYRAPRSLSYQWRLGGADIPGAQQSTIAATSAGEYRCVVTATNAAGSSSQISAVASIAAALPNPPQRPNTRISKAKISAAQGKATFRFRSSGAGASGFQCELKKKVKHKRAKFKSCKSPKTYRHLSAGRYTFEVRALAAGGADPTPARRSFRIS